VKIFINYRRDDARDAAFIIAKSLMARFGEANVFFDRQGIQAGENFVRTIESAFDNCRIFIPLIGKEWNNILLSRYSLGERDFVLEEISHALDKEVIIIPVLLDETAMPSKNDLPEKLHSFSEIQAFDFSTNPRRLPRDLEYLNEEVNKKLIKNGKPKPGPRPPTLKPNVNNPVDPVINRLPDITDIDGNIYPVVSIGDQVWMAKNLLVTHYRNGDPIIDVRDDQDWRLLNKGACCSYNNDPSNREVYGFLYNWFAVKDIRSICPEGWHIPSKVEMEILRKYSGDWKRTGGWLKESGFQHWEKPNEGATNKTGFSALPGGGRSKNGNFYDNGHRSHFWSSTRFGKFNECWNLFLLHNETGALLFRNEMNYGFSVRCIRD
jgi:uncharacterized protein (TIGR02145 family)